MAQAFQLDGQHWRYIHELYGKETVGDACILLQERLGVDVSLLLTVIFYVRAGRLSPDLNTVAHLDTVVESWRQDIVRPLRSVRRNLKTEMALHGINTDLRNEIKRAEIAAEQTQIAILAQTIQQMGVFEPCKSSSVLQAISIIVRFFAERSGAGQGCLDDPSVAQAIQNIAVSANS